MPADVEQLIDALRAELQAFGEMLALLDEGGAPSDSPVGGVALDSIRQQGRAIRATRARRQEAESHLAASAATDPRNASPEVLLATGATTAPTVPTDYVPLLQALTNEIDDLAERTHLQAVALHACLTIAAEEIEEFVGWIHNPEIHTFCN